MSDLFTLYDQEAEGGTDTALGSLLALLKDRPPKDADLILRVAREILKG